MSLESQNVISLENVGWSKMNPIEYAFPADPSSTSYCVFPDVLERDDLVLFHATPIANLEPILKNGFIIPDPTGTNGLPSVSFAKQSSMALGHAMLMRRDRPGEYCILAVRYPSLERKGLKNNVSDIHDYTLDPPPKIVGYCKVPTTYVHV